MTERTEDSTGKWDNNAWIPFTSPKWY